MLKNLKDLLDKKLERKGRPNRNEPVSGTTPTKDAKPQHPMNQAKQFMKAAEDFETSRIEAAALSESRAWKVAAAGAGIGILGLVAVVVLLPLKRTEHWLVRVDNNTGAVDTVKSLDKEVSALPEAVDRAALARYVIDRESYDWETIQTLYDATLLRSAKSLQKEYKFLWDRADSPLKTMKNYQRIVVKNPSVSFIGNQMAQVRFEKYILNTNGELSAQQSETSKWIATIAYAYVNAPMTDAERLVNPLGFQVTSYRVDPENIAK